jgi:hypothetical protein
MVDTKDRLTADTKKYFCISVFAFQAILPKNQLGAPES